MGEWEIPTAIWQQERKAPLTGLYQVCTAWSTVNSRCNAKRVQCHPWSIMSSPWDLKKALAESKWSGYIPKQRLWQYCAYGRPIVRWQIPGAHGNREYQHRLWIAVSGIAGVCCIFQTRLWAGGAACALFAAMAASAYVEVAGCARLKIMRNENQQAGCGYHTAMGRGCRHRDLDQTAPATGRPRGPWMPAGGNQRALIPARGRPGSPPAPATPPGAAPPQEPASGCNRKPAKHILNPAR